MEANPEDMPKKSRSLSAPCLLLRASGSTKYPDNATRNDIIAIIQNDQLYFSYCTKIAELKVPTTNPVIGVIENTENLWFLFGPGGYACDSIASPATVVKPINIPAIPRKIVNPCISVANPIPKFAMACRAREPINVVFKPTIPPICPEINRNDPRPIEKEAVSQAICGISPCRCSIIAGAETIAADKLQAIINWPTIAVITNIIS
jgi:hypothetical protein